MPANLQVHVHVELIGPVHKGKNHVPTVVSDHDLLLDRVHELN